MRKYQPEGSREIYDAFLCRGYNPSVDEVKLAWQRLKKNPEDIDSRLLLLGRNFKRRSDSFAKDLIWLIDNRPRHIIHATPHGYKEDEAYRMCRRRWLRQVRLNPDDVAILYHAALFCVLFSPEDSIRFLKRASALDLSDDEFPRQLSHIYCCRAGFFSPRKNRMVAHQAVEQLKIAVARYMVPSAEDSYLLAYFDTVLKDTAEVALRYDLLDDARDIGQLMLDHRSINLQRLGPSHVGKDSRAYDLSTHLGHSILGRVALGKGHIALARDFLQQMILVRTDLFSDLTLADALLRRKEREIVSDYLAHLYDGYSSFLSDGEGGRLEVNGFWRVHARQHQEQIRKWLKQLKLGRAPKLEWR